MKSRERGVEEERRRVGEGETVSVGNVTRIPHTSTRTVIGEPEWTRWASVADNQQLTRDDAHLSFDC